MGYLVYSRYIPVISGRFEVSSIQCTDVILGGLGGIWEKISLHFFLETFMF